MIYDVRNVSRSFGRGANRRVAVDQVSLQVHPQERLGIVGESGSGKTTLIRMLAALLPPSEGDILFDGTSIVGTRDLHQLRKDVQMVFQDPRSSLNPRMSVGESIMEPLRSPVWKGEQPIDHHARLREVMEQVGLNPDDASRYPHQFSGGQRQRIAIARAIVVKPRVLIADEAVSALDVSVRAQVLNLLGDLVDEYGLTMLFVSHDLSVVRHVCDSIVVMKAGAIVESGSTEQVYGEPQHPYTQQLLRSIPRLHRG